MKNHMHKPINPKVRQIVTCMGYVEVTPQEEPGKWFGLFPNGTSNCTISLNESPLQYNNSQGQAILYTNASSTVTLKRDQKLKFINLQFSPFGLYWLKRIPLTELQNRAISLDTFFKPSECERLYEYMASNLPLSYKFAFLESFLDTQIDLDEFDERLPYAIKLIRNQNHLGMDELSQAVCLSTRRFRELFNEKIGMSPSFFRKMVRFNKASRLMITNQSLSLTQVAMATHYYDQAHFIKDFKAFSGITPSLYNKQKSRGADFYNFLLDDMNKFDARQ